MVTSPVLPSSWMVAPSDLHPRAQIIKEGLDLECSSLTQRVVSRVLADQDWFDPCEVPFRPEWVGGRLVVTRSAVPRSLNAARAKRAVGQIEGLAPALS